MKKIISDIKLYKHYISINLRCMMQYKTSFFLSAMGQFLTSFNVFLGIFFLFQRFSKVEGFTYSQVLLCFSILLLEFSLAETFARGFDTFSEIIRHGEFDRILVRPRGEIIQVLGSNFELTRIGRMLQALVMFFYGILNSGIDWDLMKILTVFCMILGGTSLFAGLFILQAGLCFFTLEGLEIMNIFTDGAREFGKYPMAVYGRNMLFFTTFFIPYSLVQYYPLLYLLGRRASPVYTILPLAAMWFLLPSLALWKLGVRRYTSSGS
ncbi:MAG: ABC-2 family transporter protein [Lachnospiraceae bacterium]|nr:ABC-2 family transporter protein [Lachnospiraceae bacterium]